MIDVATAAPGGGEGAAAPIAVITPAADTGASLSISEAARALAAARHKPKEQAPAPEAVEQPQLADEANAAPVEEQPSGEAPEEAEPAQEPPIERPRSWTKDVDETWRTLPRAVQEKIAEREQEREKEIRRSQNEAAERLKGLTAKEQAAEKARQEYEAKLPAIMQALQDAQAGAFSDIKNMDDVTRLANEDPFRYLQWQAHQQKLQAVHSEMEKAETRKTQEKQSEWAQHVQKENALFAEKVPEFADKAKAKAFQDRAPEFLNNLGFTSSELADLANGKERLSIYDHRVQQLIANGLKYEDVQKAKTAVATKPVPPVQRPGVSKPAGGNSEVIQALTAKLNQTGSLKVAQELRAAQMRSQRRAS